MSRARSTVSTVSSFRFWFGPFSLDRPSERKFALVSNVFVSVEMTTATFFCDRSSPFYLDVYLLFFWPGQLEKYYHLRYHFFV